MSRIAEVNFKMVDESGGFCTGISKSGIFTEEEISINKHKELIDGVKLL